MKSLPRNIVRHRNQLLVRVSRGGMTYRAWVRGTDAEAVQLAVEKRDHFLRMNGLAGKANTGIEGISETEQWVNNRCIPCFAVHWSGDRRRVANLQDSRATAV